MNETQRTARGHAFLPPQAVLAKIPKLYETESTPAPDKMIWLHYFSPGGDYYIAELDTETGEAFGYTRYSHYPDGAEWGYISLPELERVTTHVEIVGIGSARRPAVERDLHWQPRKFSEVER